MKKAVAIKLLKLVGNEWVELIHIPLETPMEVEHSDFQETMNQMKDLLYATDKVFFKLPEEVLVIKGLGKENENVFKFKADTINCE